MPPSVTPVSTSSKREIDLLEIGAWATDAQLEEALHTNSDDFSVAAPDEEVVQEAKAGQENVTLATLVCWQGEALVQIFKALDIDNGRFGMWLSKKLPLVQQFMIPHLENGISACEEMLAKVQNSENIDYVLDIVTQFSITGYESGLS